jgi:hypothetical protein
VVDGTLREEHTAIVLRWLACLVTPIALAAVFSACTSNPAPTAPGPARSLPNEVSWTIAPLTPGELGLATEPPASVSLACGGVGLDAIVAGEPTDPDLVWLVNQWPGSKSINRTDVVWPPGYRARFGPGLVVLDASDTVRLRAGDRVGGACQVLPDGRVYLQPPFE